MGNTALGEILSKGAALDNKVKAKRGVATHLGAMTEELKALARAELNPKETDIVELDPKDIEFSATINHRQQTWLSEDNQSFLKLVRSIELAGQKLPIMVRPKGENKYELCQTMKHTNSRFLKTPIMRVSALLKRRGRYLLTRNVTHQSQIKTLLWYSPSHASG